MFGISKTVVIVMRTLSLVSVGAGSISCKNIKGGVQATLVDNLINAKVTNISPLVAKPGETVTVTGTKFDPARKYIAKFALANGTTKNAKLKIASDTSGSFTMVSGQGLGLKTFNL